MNNRSNPGVDEIVERHRDGMHGAWWCQVSQGDPSYEGRHHKCIWVKPNVFETSEGCVLPSTREAHVDGHMIVLGGIRFWFACNMKDVS